jgi:hypothetical protein
MTEKLSKALTPTEEIAIDFYGDEIYAVALDREGERQVYVPIKPISDALGLTWGSQYNRIQRDEVLSEVVELIFIMKINPQGGRPEQICLPLEYLHGWLFGVTTGKVKEELRDKIRRYKRECYQALYRHFQGDVGRRDNNVLAQVRATGLAIAQLAEQQMQMEGRVDHLDGRMDRAAQVIAGVNRRLGSLEDKLSPAAYITEEQAAEVANRVKALAEYLTAQSRGKTHYQAVYQELYRRFGVSGYKTIRIEQYEAVLAFLEDWRKSAE